jgi:2-haloacid dehalogenase
MTIRPEDSISERGVPAAVSGVKALTFDVFGTVTDWYTSIVREGHLLGRDKGIDIDWGDFALRWRGGYIPAMERVRSGSLPYGNIDALHRMLLVELLAELDIDVLTEGEIDDFNRVWHRLGPWPDVLRGLYRLKSRYIIATLSNGNISLLTNMAKNAGLPWDVVLSSELTPGHFKGDREVYARAAELLDLAPQEVMMVATHKWDLRSARAVGFRTAFVRRPLEQGPHRHRDDTPDAEADINAEDFVDLAQQMRA